MGSVSAMHQQCMGTVYKVSVSQAGADLYFILSPSPLVFTLFFLDKFNHTHSTFHFLLYFNTLINDFINFNMHVYVQVFSGEVYDINYDDDYAKTLHCTASLCENALLPVE